MTTASEDTPEPNVHDCQITESDAADRKVRRNIRLIVVAVLVFALISISSLINKLSSPRRLNTYELRDYGAIVLDTPKPLHIFELSDHRGLAFTNESLVGRWTLVFFGFTYCGDICPTTMSTLAETYQGLKPAEQDDLQVVLVTVDPERDSPEVLANYVGRFEEDFVGLSGSPRAVMNFATDLNVAFQPAQLQQDNVANYQVEHSGNLMLINPEGQLHGYFRPPLAHGSLRVAWRSIRADH